MVSLFLVFTFSTIRNLSVTFSNSLGTHISGLYLSIFFLYINWEIPSSTFILPFFKKTKIINTKILIHFHSFP